MATHSSILAWRIPMDIGALPSQQLAGCLKTPRAHSHCPLKGTGPDFTSHANSGMQLRPSVSEYQPQYPWALGPASSELAGPSPTCQQVDISPRPLQPHSLP